MQPGIGRGSEVRPQERVAAATGRRAAPAPGGRAVVPETLTLPGIGRQTQAVAPRWEERIPRHVRAEGVERTQRLEHRGLLVLLTPHRRHHRTLTPEGLQL